MEVMQKLSLCPACSACPEVEILQEAGRAVAVRLLGRQETDLQQPLGRLPAALSLGRRFAWALERRLEPYSRWKVHHWEWEQTVTPERGMTIGKVAELTGLTTQAIRYFDTEVSL